jgi:ribosome-associated heat shock protein Hsp15
MTPSADAGEEDAAAAEAKGAQRIDKWLWFARIVKSRTQAAGLVTQGKIRINRVRTEKPSQLVKAGDVVTSAAQRTVRVFRVLAPGKRRGPAPEAASLYEELTERTVQPMSAGEQRERGPGSTSTPGATGYRPRGHGRPTKRDRRKIDRLLGGH